jgi:nicotinamidase-related amidase
MKTALIIVDMQKSLLDAGPWNADRVIDRVSGLVESARAAEAPIFFVKDRRVAPDAGLHPSLTTSDGDVFIEKSYCDSFLDTPLHDALDARAIERLVVAGLQTDYCIDTTCRRAASLGYRVLLVRDAHSTFGHKHLTAEQIVAHHNRILRSFPAGRGSVSAVDSRDVDFA